MGRTASPVAPGTTPTSNTEADEGQGTALSTADGAGKDAAKDAGSTPTTGEPSMAEVLAQLKALQAKDAEREKEVEALRARVGQVSRAVEPPQAAPLPKMAEVLKRKPESPVLTDEGWYVPPVMPGSAGKN